MQHPLRNIAHISAGFPVRPVKQRPDAFSALALGIRSILSSGEIDLTSAEPMSFDADPGPLRALCSGDILVAVRGAPKAGIVTSASAEPVYASGNLALVRVEADFVDPTYLCAALVHECREGGQLRKSSGSTLLSSLKLKDLGSILIRTPDLDTQRRVGRAVGAIKDAIQAERRAVAAAENILKSFLAETFAA